MRCSALNTLLLLCVCLYRVHNSDMTISRIYAFYEHATTDLLQTLELRFTRRMLVL